ncbi:hypothetical protein ACSZNT_11130 [Aeromonas veronii]
MEAALIGLVGVLVGALLSQVFHRQNRVETYSHKVFERRLEVYESLMTLLQSGYEIANEVMENELLSTEERHALISQAIMPIASFVDKHGLYIDNYVAAHMTSTFMGAEDVLAETDETERKKLKSIIRLSYKTAKEIVLTESGAEEINKHFRCISRSKPTSPVIERVKCLEKGGI